MEIRESILESEVEERKDMREEEEKKVEEFEKM